MPGPRLALWLGASVLALWPACSRSEVASPASSAAPEVTQAPRIETPPPAATSPRVIETITRTITIPVRPIRGTDVPTPAADTPALTIRLEEPDQQAEGPQSFDVLADGGFVVADSLQERLALFDPDGKFLRGVPVGTRVSGVAARADGAFRIASATGEAARDLDADGKPIPASRALGERVLPPAAQVRLESDRMGVVRWSPPRDGSAGPPPSDLRVEITNAAERLASLQVLALDEKRAIYVTLESAEASGRSLDQIGKTVQRYSTDGRLELEVKKIPVDYYVVPNTEFRVSKGYLYQLMPRDKAVLINVWDVR